MTLFSNHLWQLTGVITPDQWSLCSPQVNCSREAFRLFSLYMLAYMTEGRAWIRTPGQKRSDRHETRREPAGKGLVTLVLQPANKKERQIKSGENLRSYTSAIPAIA